MSTRLRIVLPAVIGSLSVPLILWDIHNARVIESMGMAWDTGAPIWPYQASDILLRLLNGPAYSIAMPLANVLRLPAPMHFVLVVPAILIWWWLLGSTLDRGMVGWARFGMLVVALVLLLWSATAVPSIFRLRLDYRAPHVSTALLVLRFLTPAVWLLGLTCLLFCRTKAVVHASDVISRFQHLCPNELWLPNPNLP
jgi:type IV secretory pathway VirB2 component (pilin)